MKTKITNKHHRNRPVDILKNGQHYGHGRIAEVKHGFVRIVAIYIQGVYTRDNGKYVMLINPKNANGFSLTIL